MWNATVDEITNTVSFTCKLADGELGLPGNRTFTVAYVLQAGPTGAAELTCTQSCVTDADTFVNMTNHTYFNLAGHDAGTVLDQVATIDAEAFLPQRQDNVSSGEVRPVAGTPFDFRAPKALGRDIEANGEQLKIARGFDHCFCLDGFTPDADPRHALRLQDPNSRRTLDIFVTAPGAHLYTGNWLSDIDAKDGCSYGPRDGVAFEPSFGLTTIITQTGRIPSAHLTTRLARRSSTDSRRFVNPPRRDAREQRYDSRLLPRTLICLRTHMQSPVTRDKQERKTP